MLAETCQKCFFPYWNVVLLRVIPALPRYFDIVPDSCTTQGGRGSFKDRTPRRDVSCCDAWMTDEPCWTERWLRLRSLPFFPHCLSLSLPLQPSLSLSLFLSLPLPLPLSRSDIRSHIFSDTLSGIYSDSPFGIPSGAYSDILSGLLASMTTFYPPLASGQPDLEPSFNFDFIPRLSWRLL